MTWNHLARFTNFPQTPLLCQQDAVTLLSGCCFPNRNRIHCCCLVFLPEPGSQADSRHSLRTQTEQRHTTVSFFHPSLTLTLRLKTTWKRRVPARAPGCVTALRPRLSRCLAPCRVSPRGRGKCSAHFLVDCSVSDRGRDHP